MRFRTVILAVALLAVGTALAASRIALAPDGAPAIGGVRWVEQPDTRTPVETIPWCADSSGHSFMYPCRWDARERTPSPAWDPQAAPIGIWVTPAQGCPVRRIKTSEDDSVAWACYYAPGS